MRTPALLAALVAAVVLVRRRAASAQAERDLWTEAGVSPARDLR